MGKSEILHGDSVVFHVKLCGIFMPRGENMKLRGDSTLWCLGLL